MTFFPQLRVLFVLSPNRSSFVFRSRPESHQTLTTSLGRCYVEANIKKKTGRLFVIVIKFTSFTWNTHVYTKRTPFVFKGYWFAAICSRYCCSAKTYKKQIQLLKLEENFPNTCLNVKHFENINKKNINRKNLYLRYKINVNFAVNFPSNVEKR